MDPDFSLQHCQDFFTKIQVKLSRSKILHSAKVFSGISKICLYRLFLHSMEKKSTKVDFSPISCKKAPFYTRNGHF